MKGLLIKLTLFFACASISAEEFGFNAYEKFTGIPINDDVYGNENICFTKWDNDDLHDILLVVDGDSSDLVYYKNVGTADTPKFKKRDIIRTESGEALSFDHGWCGGIIDPKVGDLNNDGLEDLVFGRRHDTVAIYFKNSDETVTLFQKLITPNRNRPTPEIVDFNGDGLLDLIVSSIRLSGEKATIYYNTGTKEVPKFDNKHTENLTINGKQLLNKSSLLFRDINNDNKKDLIYLNAKDRLGAKFYYSLNISTNDSIVLGPSFQLKYKDVHIADSMISDFSYKVLYDFSSYKYKIYLAYHDINNDGIYELYLNNLHSSIRSWIALYVDSPIPIEGNNIYNHSNSGTIQQIGNKIIFKESLNNSQVSIVDTKGRLVAMKDISENNKHEIELKDVPPGSYFAVIKKPNAGQQVLKFVISE